MRRFGPIGWESGGGIDGGGSRDVQKFRRGNDGCTIFGAMAVPVGQAAGREPPAVRGLSFTSVAARLFFPAQIACFVDNQHEEG